MTEILPDSLRVGAVAIGRNEEPRLGACLASLRGVRQAVYVDSASTDNSVGVARENGARVVALSPDKPFTAARGRNAGARALLEADPDLEYIQFVDGDCEVLAGWLEQAQAFLDAHPDVAVVCGQRYERYPEASIYNAMADREWNTPVGEAQSSGGDSLVRVAAYSDVGGFSDDQIAHEEPEFCARLRAKGWRVWRIDARMTLHDAATFRIGQFWRRSRRAGFGLYQCMNRSSGLNDDAGRGIVRRALIWGAVLPLLTLLSLLLDGRLAVAGLALYALQWLRIGWRTWRGSDWGLVDSLKVSGLLLIGKFAEVQGMAEFWLTQLKRKPAQPIYYK